MQINKNIAISETGFIFNPLTGDSFSTNTVGQTILRKLQEGTDTKNLITYVATIFAVDKATIEKDLSDYFLMLKSYQILLDDEKA